MKIQFITLFPEMFDGVLNNSILKRAKDKGIVSYELINLRDFGIGAHKQVDDTPYGGGAGMLLKPEPIVKAIEFAKAKDNPAKVILTSPRGQLFKQNLANKLADAAQGLIIICPRYEGYDERITDWVDDVVSVGNYVLTGGEIPAMVIADSVIRLLPGVLGNDQSIANESFQKSVDMVEYTQYTKPQTFRGKSVPEVLLSGNHKEIESWRNCAPKSI